MKIVDVLVEQCRKPHGILGKLMIKNMNVLDSGLTKWCLSKIGYYNGAILEVGCGGGNTIKQLTRRSSICTIYGIDHSIEAVEAAIIKNKKEIGEGRVHIQQADVENLPYEDETFSYVLAIRTHYFWENLEAAFEEIYRVLKHGGEFLILSEVDKIKYHMDDYNTNPQLKKLLEHCGFRNLVVDFKGNTVFFKIIK